MHPPNAYTIVADIGGTNTRVALADGPRVLTDSIKRFPNAEFADLSAVMRRYIAEQGGVDPIAACVAVAGPVRDGTARMTNLDWSIDTRTLADATRAENVAILNDLQAQGHALGHIPSSHLRSVLPGRAAPDNATKLVIGVGTGFNAAPVIESESGRVVAASESGHGNLPVTSDQDWAMSQYLQREHGFAATEEVLSGRGLSQVYDFLSSQAGDGKQARSADILANCQNGNDPRATEAVAIFVRVLGTVVGNLSLIQLPFGGVYLVGGMARAIAPHLAENGFERAFRDKGRFATFLDNFPVLIVEDDYAALSGCAAYLDSKLNRQPEPSATAPAPSPSIG